MPLVIIDTKEGAERESYKDKIRAYNTCILFLNDRVVVSSNLLSEEENIYYSNLLDTNIETKEDFIKMIDQGNITYFYAIFLCTIFIYLFIIYIFSNLIDALVLGMLGYLFARLMRLRLRFKATFNIGIHALTLPIILNLIYIIVNTFTGFEIKYFQWMYEAISYIYVIVAILMIKTEIINQKIQLIKLQEIQEQVSKEAEESNPKEEEKKEKEEEKKESEKDESAGEEPEGSNA